MDLNISKFVAGAWLAHGWRMAGANIQTATTFLIFGVESSYLGSAIGSSHLETCQEMSPQLQICQVGDLRRERVAQPPQDQGQGTSYSSAVFAS